MKATRRLLPALSLALAFSAYANSSATLYGDLDIGVQYLTHGGPGGGKTIGMQSGNEQPSRFGITGTEDLGGGYAAVFRLESGFNVGTGSYTIPGTAIDRYAYIGVSGTNLGTLTLGRQRSILFEQSLFFDPTYLAEYSSESTNYIPVSSFNQSNSVKWTSPVYALAIVAGGRPVKQVGEVLGVARSNVTAKLVRPDDWRDGRTARQTDDAELVAEIRRVIADLPNLGYRRVWGRLAKRAGEPRAQQPAARRRMSQAMPFAQHAKHQLVAECDGDEAQGLQCSGPQMSLPYAERDDDA